MNLPLPSATIRRAVDIPLDNGTAKFTTFTGLVDQGEHIALVFGKINPADAPLVRIHSECLTGDVFQSARCDCGDQLSESTRRFTEQGGILLYLRQEGRGIGLYNKLDAYALQDKGYDTYEANSLLGLGEDLREYGVAAQMLRALGVSRIRLVTNNPKKVAEIAALGIEVVEAISTGIFLKVANKNYLRAKIVRTKHKIGNATFLHSLSIL